MKTSISTISKWAAVALTAALLAGCASDAPRALSGDSEAAHVLHRQYREGQAVAYHMSAINEGRHYEADVSGTVRKDAAGVFFEDLSWTAVRWGERNTALPAGGVKQQLSMAPSYKPALPDLSKTPQDLIGPELDLFTFYVDLYLARMQTSLVKEGDHAYVKIGVPASWADGTYTVLGEDAVDFDITLQAIDRVRGTVTLLVKHVPPAELRIRLPAAWMQKPLSDRPSNWVQVTKRGDKKLAGFGKETFDDVITLNLADGRMLGATMYNPVDIVERECSDAELAQCSPEKSRRILREITIKATDGASQNPATK